MQPVAHLANFPLPADRGDYGSGAVERMGPGHVLVCLLEFDSEAADTALFAHDGVPTFAPSSFAPNAMQRTIQGMSGAQAFFRAVGPGLLRVRGAGEPSRPGRARPRR